MRGIQQIFRRCSPSSTMNTKATRTEGFDTVPDRPAVLTFVLFAFVVFCSVAIAVAFKESGLWVISRYAHVRDPTRAAGHLAWPKTALIAAGTTLAAAGLGMVASHRWPRRSGLESIAATARGEDRRISLPATAIRAFGTWLMLVGLVPIGRESAILEMGGAIGSTVARRFRGHGATMAAAGMAAAFAAAYHAPIAAIAYLEEHFRIRSSRRAMIFTVGGALSGSLIAKIVFGTKTILPVLHASPRQLFVAGAIAVVPATVGARLFLHMRTRVTSPSAIWLRSASPWTIATAGAVAAGLTVAAFPAAAGNGNDALRRVSATATVGIGLAIAMTIGKAIGTCAAFGAKAPGGALTPTMTVAAGSALLGTAALHGLGISVVNVWAVAVLSAAVAVAVGLRSPITAVVLIPEMMGHLRLLPATAMVVVAAIALDHTLDLAMHRLRFVTLHDIQDEDG